MLPSLVMPLQLLLLLLHPGLGRGRVGRARRVLGPDHLGWRVVVGVAAVHAWKEKRKHYETVREGYEHI